MCQNDWRRADWRRGTAVETIQPDLEGTRLVTAMVEFNLPPIGSPRDITRGDVALAANVFARQTSSRTAVVIARQANSSGVIDKARVAVHHQGRTSMTFEFDPHNPPVSVLKSIERIINILRTTRSVSPPTLDQCCCCQNHTERVLSIDRTVVAVETEESWSEFSSSDIASPDTHRIRLDPERGRHFAKRTV